MQRDKYYLLRIGILSPDVNIVKIKYPDSVKAISVILKWYMVSKYK